MTITEAAELRDQRYGHAGILTRLEQLEVDAEKTEHDEFIKDRNQFRDGDF